MRFMLMGLCLIMICNVPAANAQEVSEEPETPEEAAAYVRSLHLIRDFEGAHEAGAKWLDQFPEAHELRAWYVLGLARDDKDDRALAEAEQMMGETPEGHPWSLFAYAAALNWHAEHYQEGLAASEKALAAAPNHPDFLWLRAEILYHRGQEESAVTLVDQYRDVVENPAELLVMKGYALYLLSRGTRQQKGDPARLDEALAAFEAARAADPENTNAHYLAGWALLNSGQWEDAYPLLKKAAAMSPNPRVHQNYWRAVMTAQDKSSEEKQAEIEADMQALLARKGPRPGILSMMAYQYGEWGWEEKLAATEEQLLEQAPYSEEAEWVFVNRYRAFAETHRDSLFDDPALRATYGQMLQDFIDRPEHRQEQLLGDAYRGLFYVARDDTAFSDEDFWGIVQGMVVYEGINPHVTHAGGAIALAERNAYFREAEQIARDGIEVGRQKIHEQHERGGFKTEGDYESALNWMTGIMYDALGWVYFNEGRLEDAKSELWRAYDLHHENVQNLFHLGQLYETRAQLYESQDDLGKAESYYLKGIAVQSMGENPNDVALQALYKKQHGSLDGYDAYLATAEERDRERRRKEVMEARLDTLVSFDAFNLKTLDGDTLSTEDLEGKVVAINAWGLWCGPCVEEMPDIQQLHEKYEADPDVLVLTINNDENVDEVRAWMQQEGYTFPILLDDGYLSRIQSNSFPTTWFLDEQRRTVFQKIGWSEELVEEFSWRIEALREPASE